MQRAGPGDLRARRAGAVQNRAAAPDDGPTDRKARAQFDRALQELQVTFNIVRSNRPDVEGDTWVPFLERYPAFADS